MYIYIYIYIYIYVYITHILTHSVYTASFEWMASP